jgi:hypothetical protein
MKTPADIAIEELRYALVDGLREKAVGYTLIRIEQILNGTPAGVAYNRADATMYVLVDDSGQAHACLDALERLDLARSLTEFFRTFVVPAQSTHGLPYWGGRDNGPFVVYKFALLDRPLKLSY